MIKHAFVNVEFLVAAGSTYVKGNDKIQIPTVYRQNGDCQMAGVIMRCGL